VLHGGSLSGWLRDLCGDGTGNRVVTEGSAPMGAQQAGLLFSGLLLLLLSGHSLPRKDHLPAV